MNGTLQNENTLIGTLSSGNTMKGGLGTVLGRDGEKGDPGISPTLKVTQEGDNVRVEATDINGTTSATVIGGGGGGVNFTPGNALELTEDGVLNVKTAPSPEPNNTLPITSAGVAATVGNIEIILQTI